MLSRKRHVLAKPSKAQQEAACSHLIRCFANGAGAAPPQPPAFFLGQLLSKQIFARLSKNWRFAILFDVLQMGGAPPNPPAHIYSTAFAGLASLSRKRHVLAKPSKAQQEAACSHLIRCFANGGGAAPPPTPFFLFGAASEQTSLCKT